MSRHVPTIAVIGGGFSGTAVAAQLLRRGTPARVLLVNRFGPMGRGVAYGTPIEAHVLNVPAGGMSALPDDADHFVRWARTRDDSIRADTFVSRRDLRRVPRGAPARVRAPHAPRRPVSSGWSPWRATSSRGRTESPRSSFSPGRASPPTPSFWPSATTRPRTPRRSATEFYETDRYVRDPWIRGALDVVRPGESVLMLGTGLTMMDIALDLARRGVKLPLFAVSRHGLLPREHRAGAAVGFRRAASRRIRGPSPLRRALHAAAPAARRGPRRGGRRLARRRRRRARDRSVALGRA